MYIKFNTSPNVKGELQEVEDEFLFGTSPMEKQENLLDAKLLLKNIHWIAWKLADGERGILAYR